MTIKAFSIAFCMLVLAAPGVPAQSGPAASDPITPERGPGSSAPDGGDPIPVTSELKFDGKGEVSGTFTGLPAPGDVKTGTFDPKTGALRLELTKQGESVIRLMLEGTVSNGAATGRITVTGMRETPSHRSPQEALLIFHHLFPQSHRTTTPQSGDSRQWSESSFDSSLYETGRTCAPATVPA